MSDAEEVELKIGDALLITRKFIEYKEGKGASSNNYAVDVLCFIHSQVPEGDYYITFNRANTGSVPAHIVQDMRGAYIDYIEYAQKNIGQVVCLTTSPTP